LTTISAQIIADSSGEHSPRLTTFLLRYPRWIHAEGRTHRVLRIGEDMEVEERTPSLMEDENLSRNASSSRAIPVEKLIRDMRDDPAVPLFWGRNQKGMQGGAELAGTELQEAKAIWHLSMLNAEGSARNLASLGAHKQLINRLLEPYTHITVVVTATQWSNFFALRRHAAAEPHIKMLADRMFDAMNASIPRLLKPGDWHLPFVPLNPPSAPFLRDIMRTEDQIKLSVARCASTSYKTVEGFDMTLDRAIALHDKLVADSPLHASPCEHQAEMDVRVKRPVYNPGYAPGDAAFEFVHDWANERLGGNLGGGWVQYRKTLAGECL
jgi:hypothetical protein